MPKIWRQHSSCSSNQFIKRLLIAAILLCFLTTLYLAAVLWRNNDREGQRSKYDNTYSISLFKIENHDPAPTPFSSHNLSHKLCVIVPFRDRYEELQHFSPFIHRYLNHKNIYHEIIIVNQVDKFRFNRASLINIGFLYSTQSSQRDLEKRPSCDYIAMHDVDLLPLNKDLPYEYPSENNVVVHVAGPGLHPKYDYPSFIGGILVVTKQVFGLVNGMSNIYWGWGLEDDEFYVRLKQNSILVVRPKDLNTGKTNTFRHIHNGKKRPRDYNKCFDQWKKTRKRDHTTGLNTVNYTMQSVTHQIIENAPIVMLNVTLHCNFEISPWCDCSGVGRKNSTRIVVSKTKKRKEPKAEV